MGTLSGLDFLTHGATAAYRRNSSGIWVSGTSPRIHHDAAGVPLGLLSEGERTGLCPHSAAMAQWTSGEGWADAAAASPIQGAAAWKLTPTTSTGEHKLLSPAGVMTDGESCVLSVLAKAGGYDYLRLSGDGAAFPLVDYQTFDLASGVLGAVSQNVIDAGIEDWGGGWHLCWAAVAAHADDSGRIEVHSLPADDISTFAGDGASGALIAYGQIEAGDRPTSPIVTGAEALTRAADAITVPLSALPFDDARGTVLMKLGADPALGARGSMVLNFARPGGIGPRHRFGITGSGLMVYTATDDAATTIADVQAEAGDRILAVSYAEDAIDVWSPAGGSVHLGTGSPPTGLETLYFGNPDVPLETLIYLPKKLTVSDMQEMAGAVLA